MEENALNPEGVEEDAAEETPEAPEEQEPAEAEGAAEEAPEPEEKTDEPPAIGEDLETKIEDLQRKADKAKADAEYWTREKRKRRDEYFKGDEDAPPAKEAEKQPAAAATMPKEDDFETYEQYQEALTDYKVAKGIAEYEARQAQKTSQVELETFTGELIAEGKEKYEDFEDVALSVNVPITVEMIDIMHKYCENPSEVAYHLGKNLNVCASISRMGREAAVRELTKLDLEAGKAVADNPAASKPVTKAPPPIKPTRSENVVTKDPNKMTQAEYEKWRQEGGGR